MSAYLLTWNPLKSSWDDFHVSFQSCEKYGIALSYWSCRNQDVSAGDRVFMLRLGRQKPNGIIASGRALCSPYLGADWDDPKTTSSYVDICYDTILDTQSIFLLDRFQKKIPRVHWTPVQSGMFIQDKGASKLEKLWGNHLNDIGLPSISERSSVVYFEGDKKSVVQDRYERNVQARKACVLAQGYKCKVCNFDFSAKYGKIGKEYIHVHHLKFLSKPGKKHEVKPEDDLVPVCPNCHAMLHKQSPPFTIEELKQIMQRSRASTTSG